MSAEINNASVNGQAEQRPPRAGRRPARPRADSARGDRTLHRAGPRGRARHDRPQGGSRRRHAEGRVPAARDLYREVSLDSFAKMVSAARIATDAEHDPLRALRRFMHVALDLRAGAALPALGPYVPISALLERNRNDSADVVDALLRRAQEEGWSAPTSSSATSR
ncbi:hypothetical protein NKH77_36880 [Streptomyces sp. M19]